MPSTPSLAPGAFKYDTTVYIVLNDFGKLGSAYVETDETEADESAVISDIISGAHSNPLCVIAFNTHEGWSRDVTEDIAHKILDLSQQGTAPSRFSPSKKKPTVTATLYHSAPVDTLFVPQCGGEVLG